MSSSHDLSHVLVALPNEWTVCLSVKLATGAQIVETTALIDCNATGNFTNIGLLSKANFPLKCQPKPIHAYNVNGPANVKGTIGWRAYTNILFSNLRKSTNLIILSLGWQQIILEMPWLCKWNPKVDWISNTIFIPKSPSFLSSEYIPQWYLLWWLGLNSNWKISNRLHKQKAWPRGKSMNKTIISTQITQAAQAAEPVIPEWCKDFVDAFSEKTHDQLPPHCPYNHTIVTSSSKLPKSIPLTQWKWRSIKTSLRSILELDRLYHWNSPKLFPSSLYQRKMGPYIHARISTTWTPTQSKMPTHSLLIDDMKESTLFTKFDIQWEYNNIHIQEKN